ncbi:MAG TPA: hypothetical protein VFY39_15855 [Gammaproteobacteria bacterium]|nr:hypothetical protein [Gammaproteobacteria bacterium]
MRQIKELSIALLLCCFPVVGLACRQPSIPIVPGKQDIHGQDRKVLAQMQRYIASMARYVACIHGELDALGDDRSSSLQRELLVRRYNQAVQEVDTMAGIFVERVGPIESLRAGVVLKSKPAGCVAMLQTDRTRVVDDHRILFYHSGHIFLNSLAADCVGLEHAGAFLHRGIGGRVNRYCSRDPIVVTDSTAASCKLGDFYEVTEAQAELMKSGADAGD